MSVVYLSLGSNMGDREKILELSIKEIGKRIGTITKVSSKYETEPWGFVSANKFINMAVEVTTELSPQEVSDRVHQIEDDLGRTRNSNGEVINHDVAKYVPETDFVVKVIDRHVEKAKHNLKGAAIVIAGGYGMGSKEGFDKLFELAKELHAEVGASRAAVDAGFCDHDRQIGQTGVTVHPKLYIACGISGQIQHIAGMQDAGIIISINNDPNAPINTIADYVINGNVEEVVPKLIKYYKKNSK